MENLKYDCICLKSVDFGENDKILTLYALGKGKISVKARGCKKPNAKLKFATFPFCFGSYILAERGGFYTLVGCDSYELFFDEASNLDRFYAMSVVLECIDKFTKEGDVSDDLVLRGLRTLKVLSFSDKSIVLPLGCFLGETLKDLGYSINLDFCQNCREKLASEIFMSSSEGGFLCANCKGAGEKLSPKTFATIRQMSKLGLEKSDILKCDKETEKDILLVFSKIFLNVCDEKIKSLLQYIKIM